MDPPATPVYYQAKVGWRCKDRRYQIRDTGQSDQRTWDSIQSTCRWDKTYDFLPERLQCYLRFCDNATQVPNASHGFNFTWDGQRVPLQSEVTYTCRDGWRFEADTEWKEQAGNFTEVTCGDSGELEYPSPWPNCTSLTHCPAPPPAPENSSLVLQGHPGQPQPYTTSLHYACINGSQFDTDLNSRGDTPALSSSCQWRGAWHPWSLLPPCLVTHCTAPPLPPPDHLLEEIAPAWTAVNSSKVFQCRGWLEEEGRHTRFFQHNRSLSSLSLPCQPDGQFTFDGFWPRCLQDVQCVLRELPAIPSHPQYLLQPGRDGRVDQVRTPHPSLTPVDSRHLAATTNTSSLANNFGADLTYSCGAARNFLKSSPSCHLASQQVTCLWNTSWQGDLALPPCDWVACLRPPAPPASSHLRLTGWDGEPVRFGDEAVYVCERGTWFLGDREAESLVLHCQDGSVPGSLRGFFDSPSEDSGWPVCTSGPLCPEPPAVPIPLPPPPSGELLHQPITFTVEELEVMQPQELGTITLPCPSFLRVFPTSVSRVSPSPTSPLTPCPDLAALAAVRILCRGSSTCSVHTNMSLALAQSSACAPELSNIKVSYSCGECLPPTLTGVVSAYLLLLLMW